MKSLNFTVVYLLLCVSALFQVRSHVLSKEHTQDNLSTGLEFDYLEPVKQEKGSENVNRVKKSPEQTTTANSPYTTTVCVQVRPDNATGQQSEEKQKIAQKTSLQSDDGVINQQFVARVAQQRPVGGYQMPAFDNGEQIPMYIAPARKIVQSPQETQVPSTFLNNQMQQVVMQKKLQARNKEVGQNFYPVTGYLNPQIIDPQIKPIRVSTDHQQVEMFQQSNLDKNARLVGNQYYRTYESPGNEVRSTQYQRLPQVLLSPPLAVTKKYILSPYPRSRNTGETAELITSNVPLTLNCDVSSDASSKEAVKIAQYTTSRQNQAQQNLNPTGSTQEIKQVFSHPQDMFRHHQIEYIRSNTNNPWVKDSQKMDPNYVIYKSDPMLEQMDGPKTMMDGMGRSMVFWNNPSKMLTPVYNYGLNEERKSSGIDNQFTQNQEQIMNSPYFKERIVAENSKEWASMQPIRALTEEELKIKEKHIEEQLKESQARLQELQKQLNESNKKSGSKDSNELETGKTVKPNESYTTESSSTMKTSPGSPKRSISRQRSTKE